MPLPKDLAAVQQCIENSLEGAAIGNKRVVGVIGDAPSSYSKSPALWNGAFRALRLGIVYLAFDVREHRLRALVRALRQCDRLLGVSVTVPYKSQIMEYLDELEPKAEQIRAVNTVVRTKNGRLVGYNTDGKGLLESILKPAPGQSRPLLDSLSGMDVLLVGAGGAARSVAFYLAEAIQGGSLIVCNRTLQTAVSLAEQVTAAFGNARAIDEKELGEQASRVGLVINCTLKGQGGIRRDANGKIFTLEPYSALAPANPAMLPETEPEFYRNWLKASLSDIEANNRASWNISLSIPSATAFCDLIYHPQETVFLRHGRLTGHRTLNGRGMLVAQAADALVNKICREYLRTRGLRGSTTYQRVLKAMWEAW